MTPGRTRAHRAGHPPSGRREDGGGSAPQEKSGWRPRLPSTKEPSIEPRQEPQGAFPPSSSSGLASSIVCGGCGSVIDASEPFPFRCPRAGDGGDHVLRRVLDVGKLAFPLGDSEPNPFVRWRGLLHSYHLGTAHGISDRGFVELVRDLDREVARVDGHGFVVTPFKAPRRWPAVSRAAPPSG